MIFDFLTTKISATFETTNYKWCFSFLAQQDETTTNSFSTFGHENQQKPTTYSLKTPLLKTLDTKFYPMYIFVVLWSNELSRARSPPINARVKITWYQNGIFTIGELLACCENFDNIQCIHRSPLLETSCATFKWTDVAWMTSGVDDFLGTVCSLTCKQNEILMSLDGCGSF